MQLKRKYLLLILLLSAGNLCAEIPVFPASTPNQATVNMNYVYSHWDGIVNPGFFSILDDDIISGTYATDLDSTGNSEEWILGGRYSLFSFPIHGAFGVKNNSTQYEYIDPDNKTLTGKETKESFRASFGTIIFGFGVSVFLNTDKNGTETENADGIIAPVSIIEATYDGDASYENKNNQLEVGFNTGQMLSDWIFWTAGISYTNIDDSIVDNSSGSGTPVKNYNETGSGSIVKAASDGWLKVFNDRVAWDIALEYSEHDWKKENTIEDEIGNDKYFGSILKLYYSFINDLDGLGKLYISPGLRNDYEYTKIIVKNTDSSATAKETVSFVLPVLFSVPVQRSESLSLYAGWYPGSVLWTSGEYTEVKEDTGTQTANRVKDGGFGTVFMRYGLGATYKPVSNLYLHALFNTREDNVQPEFTISMDYVFGAGGDVKQENTEEQPLSEENPPE